MSESVRIDTMSAGLAGDVGKGWRPAWRGGAVRTVTLRADDDDDGDN